VVTTQRHRSRLWAGLLVAAVLAPALYLAVSFLDVWWASRSDYRGTAQAIVVLGAAQYDGEPSPVLRARLDHAAALFHDGRAPMVVVTGGGREGDRTTEAKAGYDYLRTTAGVPDEQLLLEVDGTSTYESLAASARFLRRQGISEVILVSDPYHVRRVALVAAEVGLTPHVSPTATATPGDRLVREAVAVAAGRVIGFRRLDRFTH
jgi:uncharacterized SAM-binding protein YcdF (DUF218 family)